MSNDELHVSFDQQQQIETTEEVNDGNASMASSYFNLLNTILGSALLALPAVFSYTTILPGLLLLLLSACFSWMGLYLLSYSAIFIKGRQSSFYLLSQYTFPKLSMLFDSAIALKCFGVGISYWVVASKNWILLLSYWTSKSDTWWLNRMLWVGVGMLIMFPMIIMRRLDAFKYTSFLALASIGYLAFLVLYLFFDNGAKVDPSVEFFHPDIKFLKDISVIVFAYTCHQNILPIYNELRGNHQVKIHFVTSGSILIAFLTYSLVAVIGYCLFGRQFNSNFLEILPKESAMVTVAQVAYTILMMFSFPLQVHPCRNSIDKVMTSLKNWKKEAYTPLSKEEVTEEEETEEPVVEPTAQRPNVKIEELSTLRLWSITIVIYIGTFLIASLVSDLSLVLGIVGATGSMTICYILPSILYLKLTHGQPEPLWRRFGAWFLLVAGLVLMPTCLYFVISSNGAH